MTNIISRALTGLLLTIVVYGVALGQSNGTNNDNKESQTSDIVTELRLTRQTIQQLRKELVDLQIAAIQIRIQQDAVANSDVRLDNVRSEIRLTDESAAELRDRISKLESTGQSDQDEEEQQRRRTELQDAKNELERQQQRLALLRSQDAQLTAQLQIEKARLRELLSRLESISAAIGNTALDTQPQPSGPTGHAPNRGANNETPQ